VIRQGPGAYWGNFAEPTICREKEATETKRTIALCAAILLLAPAAWAQQSGEQPAMPSPEEMVAVMKLLQPGEHHKYMAQYVGNWKSVVKMWQMPGAPPTESEGKTEIVALMDGRYFQATNDGSFM